MEVVPTEGTITSPLIILTEDDELQMTFRKSLSTRTIIQISLREVQQKYRWKNSQRNVLYQRLPTARSLSAIRVSLRVSWRQQERYLGN